MTIRSFNRFAIAALLSAALQPLAAQTPENMPPEASFDLRGTLYPEDPALDVARIQFKGEPQPMGLADVLMAALNRNLNIQVQAIGQQVAEQDTVAARSIYDPVLQGTVSRNGFERETGSVAATGFTNGGSARAQDAFVARQRTDAASLEVQQLLPTGAMAYAGMESIRTRILDERTNAGSISPVVNQRAYIGFTQPLLRNLGWPFTNVTNQEIIVREKQEEVEKAFLRQEVSDRLASVVGAYWDLVFSIQNLEVQRASLAAAVELARVNQVRVDTGSAPRVDLSQSQARVSQRRNAVIAAKSQIFAAQDRLVTELNWLGEGERWNQPILPTEDPFAFSLDSEFADETLIAGALTTRHDYEAANIAVDIAEINVDVAKWQRLPELNLFGEIGSNGQDSSASSAFQDVTEYYFDDYRYGLQVRYPLMNRRAKAIYKRSQLEEDRNRLFVQQLELGITAEVRAATRALRTAQESIEASVAEVRAAQETLEAERRRLEVGTSTTFQVLEAQEDLAAARVGLAQALVNFQKGIVALEASQGTVLDWAGKELGIEFAYDDLLPTE